MSVLVYTNVSHPPLNSSDMELVHTNVNVIPDTDIILENFTDTMDLLRDVLGCIGCNTEKLEEKHSDVKGNYHLLNLAYALHGKVAWANREERVLAFRSLLFASCFRSIKCPLASLKVQSANCIFTEIEGRLVKPDISQKFFVKLLPSFSKQVDDIMVDNVHGQMVNLIRRADPKLAKHLPIYFDSFMTYTAPKLATWALCEHFDVTSQQSPFHLTSNRPFPQVPTKASVSVHIVGKTLAQYLESDYELAMQQLKVIFPPFWECLQTLALYHGFVHNDLHQGNIFYDEIKQSLVIIDYGRSHFGKYDYDDKNISKILSYEKGKYGMYSTMDSRYKSFITMSHDFIKSVAINPTSPNKVFATGITDMISVAMQMVISDYVDGENTFKYLRPILDLQTDAKGELMLCIPTHTKKIYMGFVEIMKATEDKRFLSNIAEGMFYAVLFMYFTKIILLKNHQSTSKLEDAETGGPVPKIEYDKTGDRFCITLQHLCALPQQFFLPNLLVGRATPLMMSRFLNWVELDTAQYRVGFFRRSLQKIILDYTPFLKKLMLSNKSGGSYPSNTVLIDDPEFSELVKSIPNTNTNNAQTIERPTTNINSIPFTPYPMYEDLVDNTKATVDSMTYSMRPDPAKSNTFRYKMTRYKQYNVSNTEAADKAIDGAIQALDAEIVSLAQSLSTPSTSTVNTMYNTPPISVATTGGKALKKKKGLFRK